MYDIVVERNGITFNKTVGGTPKYLPFPFTITCPIGRFFFKQFDKVVFAVNGYEINTLNQLPPPNDISEIMNILGGSQFTGPVDVIEVEVTAENLDINLEDPEVPVYTLTSEEFLGKQVMIINTGTDSYNRNESQFTQTGGTGNSIVTSVIELYEGQLLSITLKY